MELVLRCEIPIELTVAAELLGNDHRFQFEGREIRVKLPEQYYDSENRPEEQRDEKTGRCVSWDNKRCTAVSINLIIATVALLDEDGIVASNEAIPPEDATDKQFWQHNSQDHFQAKITDVSKVATRAFEYWCRVVRWKSGLSHIGPPISRHDAHPGWRYVASVDPIRHVAGFNDVIKISFPSCFSVDDWADSLSTLKQFLQPPIWEDAYHDARRRLATGDIRAAYLDTAVAIESFLRQTLIVSLGTLTNDEPAILKRIENWSTSEVLNHHNKISTLRALNLGSDVVAIFRQTFETRNSIMHGKPADLDETVLRSALAASRAIFSEQS